jgi:hypothetical protein
METNIMSHSKFSLLLLVFFFISSNYILAQSFTYSGPTNVDFVWEGTSVTATYNFIYYGIPNPNEEYKMFISSDHVVVGILNKTADGTLPPTYPITYYSAGPHIVTFTLEKLDGTIVQSVQFTLNCRFMIRHQNNFTGGKIYVENYYVQKDAPYDRPSLQGNNYLIGAIEQSDGTYNCVWNASGTSKGYWGKKQHNYNFVDYSYSQNTSYLVSSPNADKDLTLQANLRKVYNVNFHNNISDVGGHGVIIVNGTQYNSPTQNFPVVQEETITATAVNQTVTGIDYTFSSWSDGSTQNPRTFTPGDHSTITAIFVGRPNVSGRNLHFTASDPTLPITVSWNAHPSSNVSQYQIWRKVKYDKQPTGSPVLIGTVNQWTFSFVDNDYLGTNLGFTKWILYYDVKPFYSPNQTYSYDNYAQVFSGGMQQKTARSNIGDITEIVSENKIGNYPNPFNPSTEIVYQIVNPGHVSIKVYNCLGKEVADLVNEEQNTGKYKVTFNNENMASGVYFYRIVANGFSDTKKMIRMK